MAMAAALAPAASGSMSPSSSPRLPSPPPFTEVQIGAKSPSGDKSQQRDPMQEPEEVGELDNASTRRIRPGTKAADMASGPPLVPLSDLDSPFQLQEHLKALYHQHTKSEDNLNTIPITRESALVISNPPDGVDRSLWLYELCRFLVQKANSLIVAFFADTPPCSAQTCPEMRASEWQYLCAVHDPPKSCCAIDYCCHTLDWAANILTSQKHFPSRLTLGGDASGGSQQGVRQLTNIFRRVYRIFAHAWFQHRQVFWQVEGHEGLYVFFKTVCDAYSLIPEDNYTVPPEAEGIFTEQTEPEDDRQAYTELPSMNVDRGPDDSKEDPAGGDDGMMAGNTTLSTGATTRRHKHTPSTGSAVTTITEDDEDELSKGEEDDDFVAGIARSKTSFISNQGHPPTTEGTQPDNEHTTILPDRTKAQEKVEDDDDTPLEKPVPNTEETPQLTKDDNRGDTQEVGKEAEAGQPEP